MLVRSFLLNLARICLHSLALLTGRDLKKILWRKNLLLAAIAQGYLGVLGWWLRKAISNHFEDNEGLPFPFLQ